MPAPVSLREIIDHELRGLLLDKIRGAGAFRRFKNAIHQFGMAQDWYTFRDRVLKEIALRSHPAD